MKRLTYWNEEYGCWSYHGPSGEAAKRLAAYEDTGLEPEEIEQLKGEAFGLRMDKQVLEQVKRERDEARDAICTHCMDVPCRGESCYWCRGQKKED